MADNPQLPGIEVFAVDSIEQLADRLPHRSKYFTLLLAWDAPEMEQEKLMELLQPLVDCGLAYLCAWGSQCEEVHDAVDMCVAKREKEIGQADYTVMTTWHEDEPLKEVLWYFRTLAIPAEGHVFADFQRFAVPVGNPGWAVEMQRALVAVELR
ncbi:MAG TPA: hypothetical protein VKG86_04565 [Terracidiphilus sp.]|nr:hypothetical protein [Terracidiphilus sp.]